MSTDPHRPKCEHDVIQRHSPATQEARRGRRGPVDQGAEPMGAVETDPPGLIPVEWKPGIGLVDTVADTPEPPGLDAFVAGVKQAAEPVKDVPRRNAAPVADTSKMSETEWRQWATKVMAAPIADTPREKACDMFDHSTPLEALPDDPDHGAVSPDHACTCAAIQAADPARHFKGCPRRVEAPEEDSLFPPADTCPGCAKVRRHPGEGYSCSWHPPADKPTTARGPFVPCLSGFLPS